MLNHTGCSECEGNRTHNGTSAPDETVTLVFSVVLTALLALVVFSLGCTVELGKLWFHLRRPWGILVGLVCQFGLMPLTAYALAVGFAVKPVQAVAILIMGCCPGGTISNIIAYWVDGDMDLSITMTCCSTVLAMGMMPLCLFIYTRSWVGEGNIKIPFFNIGITLVTLIVPVCCGVFVNYKWPKKAQIILKVGTVVGGVLILVIGIASAVLYKGSWDTDTSMLVIGIIYPMIGYAAGFITAAVVRQPWKRCRTIALETGAQNVQVCSTMLQLSFPAEQLVLMFTFPLIYGSFQLLNGLLIVTVYQIYKKVTSDKPDDKPLAGPGLINNLSCKTPQGEVNMAFENEKALCEVNKHSLEPVKAEESQMMECTKL
ncbi:sodium-dependent organic anion transporter [Lepisosteus oculatus]|uniref:sodium-dependent organic anion transporter n=1 Tax=Lepisosteus oculatus TaxID=7918 RepID=UPI0037103B05